MELLLFVLIVAVILLTLVFAHQVIVVSGLELDPTIIAGDCASSSSTCVGA